MLTVEYNLECPESLRFGTAAAQSFLPNTITIAEVVSTRPGEKGACITGDVAVGLPAIAASAGFRD